MSDSLDNLLASVHLMRTDGGLRMTHPRGMPILIPTPCQPIDLATVFVLLSEGWLIASEERPEAEPQPASKPTTALQRRSRTRRRRKR